MLWLEHVSLMPTDAVVRPEFSFYSRPPPSVPSPSQAGLFRADLFNYVQRLHPGFLRIPGGNYLEGVAGKSAPPFRLLTQHLYSAGTGQRSRWAWKNTAAPQDQRAGHYNTAWGYWVRPLHTSSASPHLHPPPPFFRSPTPWVSTSCCCCASCWALRRKWPFTPVSPSPRNCLHCLNTPAPTPSRLLHGPALHPAQPEPAVCAGCGRCDPVRPRRLHYPMGRRARGAGPPGPLLPAAHGGAR